MKLIITHRHAFFIGLFGLYGSLVLHDGNLYPNLRPLGIPLLSTLRLFLLGIPLLCGWLLVRVPRITGVARVGVWVVWLFFLPYTIYSVTEIRHVSEVCRLAEGTYTSVCADHLWMLYPTFIYALSGVAVFIYSVSAVATKLIPTSSIKRAFILGICFYTSLASVFGLYTRFNAWDLMMKPVQTLTGLANVLSRSSFYLNTISFFLFTSILYFALQRIYTYTRTK